MARHAGRLKMGSKPAQLYVRLSIRPLDQQAYHVGEGIIRYNVARAAAFVCLHFLPYRIPECSIRSKSFALCEWRPKIPSPECSTPILDQRFLVTVIFSFMRSSLNGTCFVKRIGKKLTVTMRRGCCAYTIPTYIYIYKWKVPVSMCANTHI